MTGTRTNAFYTIGHSTRTVPELAGLLVGVGVGILVDVRTVPRSRTNPQFNRDVLPGSLGEHGIRYEHVAELGGLRGKRGAGGPSPNGHWENQSFRDYADHALTDTFRDGLARLLVLGEEDVTAVMCAEAVWWRCHRRIIADYLLVSGRAVFHVLGAGKVEPASLTPGARPSVDGILYPPAGETR